MMFKAILVLEKILKSLDSSGTVRLIIGCIISNGGIPLNAVLIGFKYLKFDQ